VTVSARWDNTGSFTANAQSIASNVPVWGKSATVQISGTYAGLVLVTEVTMDGTNWFQTQFARLDGATVGNVTGTLTASSNGSHLLRVNVTGADRFRLRATGFTSGQADVMVRITPDVTSS